MNFRPSAARLLAVPHIRQTLNGECLAACAAMCLNYLNRPVAYARLLKVLGVQPELGTQFSHILNLERLRIAVNYRRYGTLKELYAFLDGGWPCIASVQTRDLPYWNGVNVYHAIVVTGMDDNHVYVNDPELPNGPIPVLSGNFDLAWLEQDETYAVLAP